MTEAIPKNTRPKPPARSFLERLRQNPVILKELRSRMRGGRAFIILTVYLLVISAGISIVFLSLIASRDSVGGPDPGQALGKAIFGMVVGMELFIISLIAPALTAGAISSEREHQTYDLLRATLLSARSLVAGKLASPLSYLFLLLFAGIPLQSLAFLFGGVSMAEVLIANLILVITALAFSSVGLFFSSFTLRTLVSTVLSYAFVTLLLFGLPLFLVTGIALSQSVLLGPNVSSSVLFQTLLILGAWFIVSLNPVAAAVVTELILIETQSAFYFALPLDPGNSVPIVSPWISFAIIYIVLSILMVWLSVRFVKQVEK